MPAVEYFVVGGEFNNMNFSELNKDKYEEYGPYSEYCDAWKAWSGYQRAKLDLCLHRMFIVEANGSGNFTVPFNIV